MQIYDAAGAKIDSSESRVRVQVLNSSVTTSSADLSLRSVSNAQGNVLTSSDTSAASESSRLPLDLKLGGSLKILLGKIKNSGSYPLHRQSDESGRVFYSNHDLARADSRLEDTDPLDMLGSTYRNALLLSSQINQANDYQDLLEEAASNLIDQANKLNDAVYPVRLSFIYSKDCDLSINDSEDSRDIEINGVGSEFCINRLEAGKDADSQSNASHYNDATFNVPHQISLQAFLDRGFIREGTGCLYVKAEAVKTNPAAGAARDSFCGRMIHPEESRENRVALYAPDKEGEPLYQTLGDFKKLDNLIQIPIDAKGVDLQLKNVVLHRDVSANWNINDPIFVDYTVRNDGRLDANGANIISHFQLSNVNTNASSCEYLTQPAADLLTALNAGLESVQNNYSLSFNRACLNSAEAWNSIPLGPTTLNAIVDPSSTASPLLGNYYEVNAVGTGETNNSASITGIRVVAPDLKIYGLGGAAVNACNSANCRLQTSLNATLDLDVYVKNEGDGIAAPTHLRVRSREGSCISAGSDAAVPLLNPGQMVRIHVTPQVLNNYGVCATTTERPSLQNLLITLDSAGSAALGEIIEKNALGSTNAEANNTSISGRIFTSTPAMAAGSAVDENNASIPSFTPISGVGETGVVVDYEVQYVDLAITDFSSSDIPQSSSVENKVLSGKDYHVAFNLQNLGQAIANNVEVSVKLNDVADPTHPVTLYTSTLARVSHGTVTPRFDLSIRIPACGDANSEATCLDKTHNYTITVEAKTERAATTVTDRVSESNTTNNAVSTLPFKIRHFDFDLDQASIHLYENDPTGLDEAGLRAIEVSDASSGLVSGNEIIKGKQYWAKFNVRNWGSLNSNNIILKASLISTTPGASPVLLIDPATSSTRLIANIRGTRDSADNTQIVSFTIPADASLLERTYHLSLDVNPVMPVVGGLAVRPLQENEEGNNLRESILTHALHSYEFSITSAELLAETVSGTETPLSGIALVTGKRYRVRFAFVNSSTAVKVVAVPLFGNISAATFPVGSIPSNSATGTMTLSPFSLPFTVPDIPRTSGGELISQVLNLKINSRDGATAVIPEVTVTNNSRNTVGSFDVNHYDYSAELVASAVATHDIVTGVEKPQLCGALSSSGTYPDKCNFGVSSETSPMMISHSVRINYKIKNEGSAEAPSSFAKIVLVHVEGSTETEVAGTGSYESIAAISAGSEAGYAKDITLASNVYGSGYKVKIIANIAVPAMTTPTVTPAIDRIPEGSVGEGVAGVNQIESASFDVHIRPNASVTTTGTGVLSCRPGIADCRSPTATVTLHGACDVNPESGRTVTGSWCRIGDSSCTDLRVSGTSFPVDYTVTRTSVTLTPENYRFECTANDLYAKTETIINFTSP